MSLVDSWPSTETRSKERLTHTPSSRSAVSALSSASVCTKHSIVAKRGEIMPAPLHWALSRTRARRTARPPGWRASRRRRSSGSRAGSRRRPRALSRARAARMPFSTASTGRYWLIPPVEASATCAGSTPAASAAAPWVLAASSSPRSPVAALAQPELASTARSACRSAALAADEHGRRRRARWR